MSNDPRTRDDLIMAMRQRACPLCVLVERAERKSIDLFLYDQVNDISRRDALRASRGMCLRHTVMLAEGRSALGVAIVSRDILRTMTAELEEAATATDSAGLGWLRDRLGTGLGAQLAARIGPRAACPMCAEIPIIEAPLIAGLLRNFGDTEFVGIFESSAGLCRVHLEATLRVAGPEAARALAARQAAIWRRLEGELDEFIRKHDHRFSSERLDPDERDVWRRALQSASGWYK